MTRKQLRVELARLAVRFVPSSYDERAYARYNATYRAILRGVRLMFAESELKRRERNLSKNQRIARRLIRGLKQARGEDPKEYQGLSEKGWPTPFGSAQ